MKPELKQELINKGWEYKGGCNCGGGQSQKFSLHTIDGDYALRIRPRYFLLSTPGNNFQKHSPGEINKIVDEIYQKHFKEEDKF